MAAHRRPRSKHRPFSGPYGRTAATLALAGAATAAGLEAPAPAHAEPRLTSAQVRAQVDKLHHEAEIATEKYNGAKERAADASAALDRLRDRAARRTEQVNASRNALGAIATAQYRAGGLDPAVQLALSSDPDQYLRGAALAERAGFQQAKALTRMRAQLGELGLLRKKADAKLDELKSRQADLATHKSTVRNKLADAERLLDRLTAAERAEYARSVGPAEPRADRARSGAVVRAVAAPGPRAAAAVAYARAALGKPYVWGATGPNAFDCSGLTQAAWRAAGVALPRTTYTQINAGRRVSRSQLAPGDLVFFYSGISHVGLYVGGGQMIHAPRPGTGVRLAPIDQMPFAGASRPA
ncbi:NlpC/P60 family protein [Streptomyces sp. NBC_01498]|uniref:C40 family peptidase n=1 Tax=Streptomyces sp. NBC_01498 TaxID=2975870 RepID=UPI002E7BEA07|nr:NlpC/P60 family protein [Streptomyces sp. NBC_01498]WTL25081.1 NlpC/P60 family protein [Streptomyces sp. NBC_01498]